MTGSVDTSVGDISQIQTAGLEHNEITVWFMFWEADIVVKAVMLILVVASVWTWAIIFEKRNILKRLNKRAKNFEDAFWSGEPLDKLHARVKKSENDPMLDVFSEGMNEWNTGVQNGLPQADDLQAGLRQRIERTMAISINREMNRLERGMTFLATTGSVSPFIGLFGTVWGIMNSFAAIANTQNTNLAVVAPGIAEALFATALGLVAAIPAVVAYNTFTHQLARYGDRLEALSVDLLAILSRYIEQQRSFSGSQTGRQDDVTQMQMPGKTQTGRA